MNERERFEAIMSYQPSDRLPVWFFGTWRETKERWRAEGMPGIVITGGSGGPQLPEMDPDWEAGMWSNHGMASLQPIGDQTPCVLEETADHKICRDKLGGVLKIGKQGSSIPHAIEYPLKPAWESWERFKTYLNPDDPRRRASDWQETAHQLKARPQVTPFLAGSLFGWLRDWMGLEEVSYLPYDNPELLEAMLDHLVDYFPRVLAPALRESRFDFGYIFEDCCGKNGPLLSPATYQQFFAGRYRKLVDTYHALGVKFVLLDSDGKVDALIPHWLDSGIDIVFPIEHGTWKARPVELRQRFGRRLRMMGGVDKHVIPKGEAAIREHLRELQPLAREGGFIPLPDHRIPPDCSLEQFRSYIRIFKEVFNQESAA